MRPLVFIALFTLIAALFCGCDLLTAPTKPDFFKNLEEEIAWANADRLVIRVDYPPEWGSSPQQGDLSKENTRKGYGFTVEFTPLPGYGFEKWLAFPSAEYINLDKTQPATEVEAFAFSSTEVAIATSQSVSGAISATVVVFTDAPVTIVPWCSSCPALDQRTNPPINPVLTPFPYDQPVNIWFTMPVKTATITLDGEKPTIAILGVWASGNERGQPFGETGDLRAYFTIVFPDPPDPSKPSLNNRAILVPKEDTASELALLSITVTVGPGIESASGVGMAAQGLISYQTDMSKARAAYRATNIRASETAAGVYFWETEFSRPDIDRRFTQNANHPKNTVNIRFEVEAPEGAPDANPNRIIVVERRFYSLRGFDLNPGTTTETSYTNPGPGVSLASNEFTIAHTLKTELSGIVQLVVLPWYEGSTTIEEIPVHEAVAEGRFVTIVMDNAAPDVEDPQVTLSTPTSKDDGVFVYAAGVPMTLTLGGLSGIVDNGIEGGIPASRAYTFPWTMDDRDALYWYAMIGENATTPTIAMPNDTSGNPRQSVNASAWALADLSTLLAEGTTYQIYVKYEDSLGNVSPTWMPTGLRVMYSSAITVTVDAIRAYCNPAGNGITVKWDETASNWTTATGTYPYPEVVITTYRASPSGDIEESTRIESISRGVKTHSFTVPQIVSNRVREGQGVSNVYGYEIKVVTHNVAGDRTTAPIWVYNIPEMATAESIIAEGAITYLPLERLTDTITSTALLEKKNYVLTQDIAISSHSPIGTNSGAAAFTGRFYGNGHTVTIQGFATPYVTYMGLFGYAENALIRDLSVVYYSNTAPDNIVNITTTITTTHVGGIAAFASGTTGIYNIITGGSLKTGELSRDNRKYLGGIVGDMHTNLDATIANCRAGMDFDCTNGGAYNSLAHFGGLLGGHNNLDDTSGKQSIKASDVTGNLRFNQNNISGAVSAGGVLGRSVLLTEITDVEFSGTIFITRANNSTGESNIGGLGGRIENTTLSDCRVSGLVETGSFTSGNSVNIGGLIGNPLNIDATDSWVRGNIYSNTTSSSGVRVGGIAGQCNTSTLTNVWYEQGTVTATGTSGELNIGGVFGMLADENTLTDCRSLATLVYASRGSGTIYAGGFVGSAGPINLIKCYAQTEVRAESGGSVYAGGLVGAWAEGTLPPEGIKIAGCYATGKVTAVAGSGGSGATAGGLIGYINFSGTTYRTVNGCYALGDVHADRTGGIDFAYAGGLVGNASDAIVTIEFCFAKGNVSVQSIGSNDSRVGGLVGNMNGSSLNNNAAIGTRVTSMGSTTPSYGLYMGRIHGGIGGGSVGNNYARDTMFLGVGTYTHNPNPVFDDVYTIPLSGRPINNAGSRDGESLSDNEFRDHDIWTDSTGDKTWLNFDDAIYGWDFNKVSQGWPTLYDVGGQ